MKAMHMITALLVAAPLAAQQPDSARRMARGHMGPMRGMMAPMMRGMAYAPDHLLMMKTQLALTDQQVARLTAIRDAVKAAHDAAAAEAKTHRDALEQVFRANVPDTAALRQHFLAAHTAMGNAHLAMLKAAAQAKGVLTDAQRARVEGWGDVMQMHGDHMMQRGPGPAPHERHQPSH